MSTDDARDWTRRPEGGSRFAIGLICGLARHGGRALARTLLYPTTAYFLLRRAPERAASRSYLSRVLGGFFLGEYVIRHRLFRDRPYRNFVDFIGQMGALGPGFWRDLFR